MFVFGVAWSSPLYDSPCWWQEHRLPCPLYSCCYVCLFSQSRNYTPMKHLKISCQKHKIDSHPGTWQTSWNVVHFYKLISTQLAITQNTFMKHLKISCQKHKVDSHPGAWQTTWNVVAFYMLFSTQLAITQYTPMKHLKISCQKHKIDSHPGAWQTTWIVVHFYVLIST